VELLRGAQTTAFSLGINNKQLVETFSPFYHNIRWNVSAGTKVLNQYQLLIFENNVIKSSYNQVVFMTAVEVPTPHPTPQSMVPLVALASELVEETTNSACIYKQQHSLTQAF